jgi:hypothetical protein
VSFAETGKMRERENFGRKIKNSAWLCYPRRDNQKYLQSMPSVQQGANTLLVESHHPVIVKP